MLNFPKPHDDKQWVKTCSHFLKVSIDINLSLNLCAQSSYTSTN